MIVCCAVRLRGKGQRLMSVSAAGGEEVVVGGAVRQGRRRGTAISRAPLLGAAQYCMPQSTVDEGVAAPCWLGWDHPGGIGPARRDTR